MFDQDTIKSATSIGLGVLGGGLATMALYFLTTRGLATAAALWQFVAGIDTGKIRMWTLAVPCAAASAGGLAMSQCNAPPEEVTNRARKEMDPAHGLNTGVYSQADRENIMKARLEAMRTRPPEIPTAETLPPYTDLNRVLYTAGWVLFAGGAPAAAMLTIVGLYRIS